MPHPSITLSTEPNLLLARINQPQLDEDLSRAMVEDILAITNPASVPATPPTATPTAPIPVLLDLSQVSFMPSTAIGALMTLWKKLRDTNHPFTLSGTQPPVRQTLATCRLDKFFHFSETEPEARAHLRG